MFETVSVVNLEDFSADEFGKRADELSIFCVATHYEGEPCDNTAKFYDFIRQLKKSGQKSL